MSFFKRLFSGKKETTHQKLPFSGIGTEEYFDTRYTRDDVDPGLAEGCLKMVQSYFIDNKIGWNQNLPVNHPENLDKTASEGFGFALYCKAFEMDATQATLFLALAFATYYVDYYDFVLYKDNEPEYPLRGMTLKYDKDGVVLSLYPFEYANKVLNFEATFSALHEKLSAHIKQMPTKDEILKDLLPGTE
jgi:hypothetical protein